MKKVLKLAWMLLFALPLVTFTSCGDDDEPGDGGISIKDYSDLLGQTRDDILDKKMKNYEASELETYYISYLAYDEELGISNDLGNNIAGIDIWYTLFEEESYGYKPYDKSVMVDCYLYGLKFNDVFNYLADKYGKASMVTGAEGDDFDYQFEKGDKYIWLTQEVEDDYTLVYITYVDKKKWDDAYTKAASTSLRAMKKAAKK